MDSRYRVLEVADVVMPSVPRTRHYVRDGLLQNIRSVAIVELIGAPGFYLIYRDEHGSELTDTFHESIEAAKEQAAFEFDTEATEWKSPHFCPICGLPIRKAAYTEGQGSLDICPCCRFQYGWKDALGRETLKGWREKWIRAGAAWPRDAIDKPADWDAAAQLQNIGIDLAEERRKLGA